MNYERMWKKLESRIGQIHFQMYSDMVTESSKPETHKHFIIGAEQSLKICIDSMKEFESEEQNETNA